MYYSKRGGLELSNDIWIGVGLGIFVAWFLAILIVESGIIPRHCKKCGKWVAYDERCDSFHPVSGDWSHQDNLHWQCSKK